MTEKKVLLCLLNRIEEIQHTLVSLDAKLDEITERMDFEDQQCAEKLYGVNKTLIDEFEEFAQRGK